MFGENLKTLRKQKGFSQEELATRLHVVRQTISKWEKNLSVPDADTLIRLAEILEVSVSELLGANIENEKIAITLEQVISMVLDCVEKTNQTYVDELKKKGEFTKEASEEAFKICKETALAMLSEDAKKIIAMVYGDVDTYLDTLIEATVRQLKK